MTPFLTVCVCVLMLCCLITLQQERQAACSCWRTSQSCFQNRLLSHWRNIQLFTLKRHAEYFLGNTEDTSHVEIAEKRYPHHIASCDDEPHASVCLGWPWVPAQGRSRTRGRGGKWVVLCSVVGGNGMEDWLLWDRDEDLESQRLDLLSVQRAWGGGI